MFIPFSGEYCPHFPRIGAPLHNKNPPQPGKVATGPINQCENNRSMSTTIQDTKQCQFPATMKQKLAWLKEIHADPKISQSGKSVAFSLFAHHNEKTGQCNPSQSRIATAVCLSRKRVNALVAELVSGGWIETHGTTGSSYYRLRMDRLAAVEDDETDEGVPDPRQGVSQARDRGCPIPETGGVPNSGQGLSQPRDTNPGTEPSREPTKGTVKVNPAVPATVDVPPVPMNDDRPDAYFINQPDGFRILHTQVAAWQANFPHINVSGELLNASGWAVEKLGAKWFHPLQSWLAKMDRQAKSDVEARKATAEVQATSGRAQPNKRYAL